MLLLTFNQQTLRAETYYGDENSFWLFILQSHVIALRNHLRDQVNFLMYLAFWKISISMNTIQFQGLFKHFCTRKHYIEFWRALKIALEIKVYSIVIKN